jgi:hypothetical protein
MPFGGGPQTLPGGQNPGITGGPPGGPPQSTSGNEPSIIPLPGGGILALPNRPLTAEERMVLGGVRAGNPVGGPAAQAILDQLVAQGVVTPGSDPASAPVYRFNATVDPPGGGPQPPVYTQNRVTQEQNNQAFANGYQGMTTAQRWQRYNAAQNPAPPANDPNPAPVEPTPVPSIPYVPPPTWGGPAGGGQQNSDEINANQGPRPQDGGSPPFYPGPPGQSLPGPKGGSPPFYPGPQKPPKGAGGPRPRGPVKPQQTPGAPPFNSNPQATHASTLRTFLG